MKTYIVDAFTDQPFSGNPAGVCLVDAFPSEHIMLSIAQELALSETAFVQHKDGGNYAIRYFSPVMEIPLCGHATLGSASVLHTDYDRQEIHFHTASGLQLNVTASAQGIVMEFPIYATQPASAPEALLQALGLKTIVNSVYNEETKILLLEITDTQELASLTPDFSALYASHDAINGVLVTAPATGSEFDFHSRYFWPWSGTNEDPVTGGTHTFLAKYWSERLGKTHMRSYQSSARSGFMELELRDGALLITGLAKIVLRGDLFI